MRIGWMRKMRQIGWQGARFNFGDTRNEWGRETSGGYTFEGHVVREDDKIRGACC